MESEEGRSYLKTISILFHPLFVPLPVGILALNLAGYSLSDSVMWVTVSSSFIVLPLAAWAGYMLYTNQDMNNRSNRYPIYGMVGVLTVLLIVLLRQLHAPKILMGTLYASALAGFLAGIINIYIKVSLHAGVWAGAAVILFYYSPVIGALTTGLTVFIAGVRFSMGRHTITELLIAILLPVISLVSVFHILGVP